ncbi:MAG: transporter substrate-binding domain-containing protein [Synergistaceae bacterium]|nr:transporter substrate-binding domain-containing protein [Synergistaceae bacterium]
MKKFLLLILVLLLSVEAAYAHGTGFLTKLNITEDEYGKMLIEERKNVGWQLLREKRGSEESSFKFYDSLVEMELGLQRGDIDDIIAPSVVAEYILNVNKAFAFGSVEKVRPVSLACGFNERDTDLRDKFNQALISMKEDGTLLKIVSTYLATPGLDEPTPVKIDRFDKANTLIVAVTGDMPPVDFVDEGGSPAGFNMAVMAEIGRRLKMNLAFANVNAGTRAAALVSRRVNAVFWYFDVKYLDKKIDVPDGVILSEPYYEFDKFIHIKLRDK